MTVGILKETVEDNRVALLPEGVKSLFTLNVETVLVEASAGINANADDEAYKQAGGRIASSEEILKESDILLKVNEYKEAEVAAAKAGSVMIGVFQPLFNPEMVNIFRQHHKTSFSLDIIPRTTRAQSMDILSSMATVAGYKAVLLAAENLPKFFPMFMTAAGSIAPAKVLILGAGVAGLQAIATARRLGAVVEAFDVRSAVKEEVQSLGAKFVEVQGAQEDKAAGGYAVEQTEDYKRLQQEAIDEHAIKSDVVISTAQIPGRKAPLLISKDTVEKMKPGSVIIDLAASSGGNCELSKPGQTVVHHQVKIIGPANLASNLPSDASKMFGKNVINFLKLIIKDGQLNLNFDDDIVKGTCVTHEGEIISERVRDIQKSS